jgi:hypothetical protein
MIKELGGNSLSSELVGHSQAVNVALITPPFHRNEAGALR